MEMDKQMSGGLTFAGPPVTTRKDFDHMGFARFLHVSHTLVPIKLW